MRPGTAEWRGEYWSACEDADLEVVSFSVGVRLAVARDAREAFDALFDTMAAHRYPVRPDTTGTYNCRPVTGGSVLSSHAFGIAVDVNWDTNPYSRERLVTDMPRPMIDSILAIRTVEEVSVWRWGGDWDGRPDTPHSVYDAMHFEIVATPEQLRAGIPRVQAATQITGRPTLRRGSRGPAVRDLQDLLEIRSDGIFGPKTEEAVRQYQSARGLQVDGIVGPQTWTALVHDLPPLEAGDIPPGKSWT